MTRKPAYRGQLPDDSLDGQEWGVSGGNFGTKDWPKSLLFDPHISISILPICKSAAETFQYGTKSRPIALSGIIQRRFPGI
jgi:hypothetical protein